MGEIWLKASEQSANNYATDFCLFSHLHSSSERQLLDKEILAL